jgi:hypothetical protein
MPTGSALTLSGSRKRALVTEDAADGAHRSKKRNVQQESTDYEYDNTSLDSDIEAFFSDADDDEDAEEADNEPEQGEILWSEDQEEYPPCAIYHADVKKHQAHITEIAAKVTDQLSKICHKGNDIAKLHAEANVCQRFPELKKMVVALVGDAGSGVTSVQDDCGCADCTPGKSSLINSILDIPYVSQEVSADFVSSRSED